MIAALIIKELRQHWLVMLLLGFLLGVGFLLLLLVVLLTEEGSLLEALRLFLQTFVVLALLVLCHRLVVQEYQGKTQLFLEALPLARWRMVATKFLLGLVLIAAIVSVAFGLLLLAGQRGEVLTGRFVQIVAARVYAYLLCVYAFFFVMGLLGRYRVALYVVGILSVAFLETTLKVELARFGPFALLNEQFAYERNVFPVTALFVTLGLAAMLIATAFGLSLVREGSVATMLAERMSHREKVFVSLLVLGFLVACSVHDEKTEKDPFEMPGSVAKEQSGITVKVTSVGKSGANADQRLAEVVWTELDALRQYLQLSELPPVFIVLRGDLDGDRYERGELDGAEGVLVRANFTSTDWNQQDFLAWLVREVLVVASDERLLWEPRRWVLDGFALFWANRATLQTADGAPRTLVLRAAYGAQLGLKREDLDTWLAYRQRVGDEIASAVAWSGLVWVARTCGEAQCQQFLRAVLRTDIPSDVRGWWYDRRHPWPLLLQQTCDVAPEDFTRLWLAYVAHWQRETADELSGVPRLDGALHFEALSPMTYKAVYSLTADPVPPNGRFQVLHGVLAGLDVELPRSQVACEDLDFTDGPHGELPGTFTWSTRLYWTYAVRSEVLGCDVVSGWRCQEVRP